MVLGLRIVLGLLGLLFVFMGAGFLFDPAGSGANFGLEPIGAQGLSSIRGDLTAFFWVSGGSLLLGVWRRDATLLMVAAALMGIVCAARGLSLALDGTYEGWAPPMVVEGLTATLALVGARLLPRS
jgi:hypothetical protein